MINKGIKRFFSPLNLRLRFPKIKIQHICYSVKPENGTPTKLKNRIPKSRITGSPKKSFNSVAQNVFFLTLARVFSHALKFSEL